MSKPNVEKLAAQKLEIRDKCRTDKMYLSQILGYYFQEDVHEDLFANYIKYDNSKNIREQSDIKNRLVLWSRGFFKTTSIVVEIVQLILNFPDVRILLMQATVTNTKYLLKEIKSHFDGSNPQSKLKDYFPEFCDTEKRLGTEMMFTVPNRTTVQRDPTVRVASPKTMKAGQHYDAAFFDDLVNEVNFRSPSQIKKAIDDFNMYTPLIDPGGYRFVTGTRYAFGDLYEWIIRKNESAKEWNITVRPCWHMVGDKLVSNFPPRKLENGKIIGISIEDLLAKQAEDPEMFASQYLNQPVASGMHLFPQELLMTHVQAPQGLELGHKTLFIDYASGRDKKSDHSVILCGQKDSMNKIYCTDGVGGSWSPDQTANAVINMALKHKPVRIYIEKSAAGEAFVYYLKELARNKGISLPIDFIEVSVKPDAKHMRISLVSGYLKQNRLFFFPGLPCWEKMMEQFIAYPRTKHDDYPDTVALMCEHYQAIKPIPQVKSLANYILTNEATPIAQYILQTDHESNHDGGSMGSDF